MKKFLSVSILAVLLVMGLDGCGVISPMQPSGLLAQDVEAPLSNLAYYGATTPNATKKGESSYYTILGLFSMGDASVYQAMKSARITKVHNVNYHYLHLLFIFDQYTTVVYGE